MTAPINITALTLETPASTNSTPGSGSRLGRVTEGFTTPLQNENPADQRAEDKFDSILKNHIDKKDSSSLEEPGRHELELDIEASENEVLQIAKATSNQQAPEELQTPRIGIAALNQGAPEDPTGDNDSKLEVNLKSDTPRRTPTVAVADKNQPVPEAQKGDSQIIKEPLQKTDTVAVISKDFSDRSSENQTKKTSPDTEQMLARRINRESAPASQNPAPASQNPAPASQNPAPASQSAVPANLNPVPANQNPAPTNQSAVPTNQNPAPTNQSAVPANQNPVPISQNVDPPKQTDLPSSTAVEGDSKKLASTNIPVNPESETTSTPFQQRVANLLASGNSLPRSGKLLPAATSQSTSQATIELVPGLEQALIRPSADALTRTGGSASAQRLSIETAPVLPLDKSLLNTDLEPLLRSLDPDAARSLVPPATTLPGIGKSLLNTRLETKTRRIGLGSPQAIEKTAAARPGLEKILANSAIPASELFSNAVSQSLLTGASIDPAVSSQSSSTDSQTATLLANYQTNSKQIGDSRPSLTIGLKADAPMPSNLAPGSRQWSNEIGSRIRWMSNSNVSSAKLSLHPAELGSLEILIASEDNQTRVNFITSNAAAKEVIESSLPRLRELLSESGLQLEQGDVTHQEFNRNDNSEQLPINEKILAKENENEKTPQNSLPQFRPPSSNWQVDHYA